MRAIDKRDEPPFLQKYRKGASDDLDSEDKGILREALVSEQRGLCCYCMGRIAAEPAKVKIEHWRSRARFPAKQYVYRNLLAACTGGEGTPRRLQHCDTHKRDGNLKWNPADPYRRIEDWIRYEFDGSIRSSDDEFNQQLESVLNLNIARLKNCRKAKLDGILDWWRQDENATQKQAVRSQLEKRLAALTGGSGVLDEYCQVLAWWLDQRIKNLTS